VDAAEPITYALHASTDVATPSAVAALTEQVEAARDALSATDVDSDQAIELARKSSSNFVAVLLRVATWIRKEPAVAAKEFRSGIYRWSGPALIASGHLPAIVTFIVDKAAELRVFVEAAFHSPPLARIIDLIVEAAQSMPI
jgi:hypothetical protein